MNVLNPLSLSAVASKSLKMQVPFIQEVTQQTVHSSESSHQAEVSRRQWHHQWQGWNQDPSWGHGVSAIKCKRCASLRPAPWWSNPAPSPWIDGGGWKQPVCLLPSAEAVHHLQRTVGLLSACRSPQSSRRTRRGGMSLSSAAPSWQIIGLFIHVAPAEEITQSSSVTKQILINTANIQFRTGADNPSTERGCRRAANRKYLFKMICGHLSDSLLYSSTPPDPA